MIATLAAADPYYLTRSTIKQMFKLYISVLGVYIITLDWLCKIPEVYKAPRLACILFGETVTRNCAIDCLLVILFIRKESIFI